MTKKSLQISLVWRDENHGSVHAIAAFRVYLATVDWSQRTHAKFRACVRRAGFAFHDGRCAYIAATGEQATREKILCAELAKAGFQIIGGDVRSCA